MCVVTPGLWIAGSVLCLFAPPKSGGFPLILSSLILDGVSLVLMLILWVLGPFAMFAGLVLIAAWVMFMLFLRALATYIREHGSADEAMALIYLGVGLMVGAVVFFLGLFALGYYLRAPILLIQILGFAGTIGLVVLDIQFLLRTLSLIGSLRRTIETRG
jgi:hypothetical protein